MNSPTPGGAVGAAVRGDVTTTKFINNHNCHSSRHK